VSKRATTTIEPPPIEVEVTTTSGSTTTLYELADTLADWFLARVEARAANGETP